MGEPIAQTLTCHNARREPVKLSRGRWEMLAQQFRLPPRMGMLTERIHLDVPREINGVIFLPAEYVPGGTGHPPGTDTVMGDHPSRA